MVSGVNISRVKCQKRFGHPQRSGEMPIVLHLVKGHRLLNPNGSAKNSNACLECFRYLPFGEMDLLLDTYFAFKQFDFILATMLALLRPVSFAS